MTNKWTIEDNDQWRILMTLITGDLKSHITVELKTFMTLKLIRLINGELKRLNT